MSNRKLGLLVALKSPEALKQIELALAARRGAKHAAKSLGVARETLTRWSASWTKVRQLLQSYALDSSQVGSLGGTASARKRRARR